MNYEDLYQTLQAQEKSLKDPVPGSESYDRNRGRCLFDSWGA